MIRPTIAALALLVVPVCVFAQNNPADTPLAESESPPFTASLLLIRFDWSKAPGWKEIEADLQKAWSGEAVTKDNLAKLPASGPPSWPRILFPESAVSIYSQQHYAQLLAWLKARQLVMSIEPFTNHPTEPAPGVLRGWYAPTLSKSYESFGLSAPQAQNDLFFTRTTEFTWSVRNNKVEREFGQYEKGRGQEEIQLVDRNSFDRCQFTFNPLEDGQVMIAPAFPDVNNDLEFRTASNGKGFEALIVVEKGRSPANETVEPKPLLPDKVERIKAQRTRGVSGAGWSMPQAGRAPAAAGPPPRYIISKSIMISWSEAKDVAWGFSEALGKWAEQKMDPPAANSAPLVGEDIAVWRVGNDYYAFSSQAARWDALRLPKDHSASPPVIDTGFVRVHDGDDLYTFSGSTGRWSSPKGSAEPTETKLTDETGIKIFTLRHAKATEAAVLISQLFVRDIHSAVADERSNSLIVRGPKTELDVIHHILLRLDEEGGGNQAPQADKTQNQWPKGGSGTGEGSGFGGGFVAETVEELAKRYGAKDQEALALARQIKDLQSAPEAHKQAIKEMTATLRRLVGEAFAARQRLHHAEVGQLQQRIAGIQKNVATRDKLSDTIIEVRVNDLLNPELQWESRPRPPGGTSATGAPAASTPSASRPKVTMEPWWGPESEQTVVELGIQVQKLTRDDAPEPNLIGAWKITSIDPESPAKDLQVGDVIRGLQTTSGHAKGWRRVEIHIRRGNQSLAVIVELPPRRATSSVPGQPGEISRSYDFAGERAYRDKQRQRWEQIERLYQGGRMEFDVMMQAARDLADAELAAAATAEDRRSARQRSLELLKAVKSIVDAKFEANVEPEHKKLAVDAEVLKAEAQLAAEKNGNKADVPPTPQDTSTPVLPQSLGSQAAILRSPDDFRKVLGQAEDSVTSLKTRIAELQAQGKTEDREDNQKILLGRERRLAWAREEYAAQLRLIELEVQDASSAVEAAAQQHKVTQQEFASGHSTRGSVVASERAVQESTLRLQRAKTLLDLYRKADSKNSVSQPGAEPAASPVPASSGGANRLPTRTTLPGPGPTPTLPATGLPPTNSPLR